MKRILIIALSTALAAPAFAGGKLDPIEEPEVATPEPVPAPAMHNWTGPYVGGTFGFGRVSSSGAASSETGFGAAPHAGYNMDMGDWIVGAEIEVLPNALVDLSTATRDMRGTSGRVKLRAGPKLGADGRTFAFGTLGAAQVRSSSATGNHSDTGILGGVGVSHAIQDNFFATGEILYHRFGNAGGTNSSANATTATVGLSFRF